MAQRLRILCLHGFTSNAGTHAHQLRRLTALLPEYDFLFADGPHQVEITSQMNLDKPANAAWTDLVNSLGPQAGHRGWWYARDNATPPQFVGLEDSLSSIGKLIVEKGPIHAIWGFSQGACFAGMLCALFQDKMASHPLRTHLPAELDVQTPVSGVMFSGFRPRFEMYDSLYEPGGIDVPVLSVCGEQDDLVDVSRSEELLKYCKNGRLLKHDGGHDIPKKEEYMRQIVDFVRVWTKRARNNDSKVFQASI